MPSMQEYVNKIQNQSKQLELELLECDDLLHEADIGEKICIFILVWGKPSIFVFMTHYSVMMLFCITKILFAPGPGLCLGKKLSGQEKSSDFALTSAWWKTYFSHQPKYFFYQNFLKFCSDVLLACISVCA